MITKTAVAGSFYARRNYSLYDDMDRPMTKEQKRTLADLIYSRISNPEEVERRLSEIEDYTFTDAQEAINDFLFMFSK